MLSRATALAAAGFHAVANRRVFQDREEGSCIAAQAGTNARIFTQRCRFRHDGRREPGRSGGSQPLGQAPFFRAGAKPGLGSAILSTR